LLYRQLGQTDLTVSSIGFGASALGNVYSAVTPEQCDVSVQYAIDSGINFFDVAPYYGLTLAEERLGAALSGHRDQVILATKCGRYGVDKFDFSARTITKEFESSLRRLKTTYVDVLQVHDLEFGSIECIVNETLPAIRLLQQQGKVRYVGITSYWPELLASVLKSTTVDTVLSYCHSNLLMNDMDDELTPAAAQQGIGLINASPLHMGLLGGGFVPDWHPASSEVKSVAREIVDRCRSYDLPPGSVALRWCLNHPTVGVTLVGLASVEEVDDALAAMALDIPHELLSEIRQIAAPVYNNVWSSGLIENQPPKVLHAR
jgi:L-galactose dehydrogenase